jgi:hypothetical protein
LDLLDLFGSYYVIEHVLAEHNIRMEEKVYRSYTGDLLKVIAESIGATVNYRLMELLEKPKEEKTGDEIALEVIKRAGLKVKNNDTI